MNLTFLVLHEIYGNVAAGYHIFNVVLAGCIACLVFAATFRWTKNRSLAWVSAVIFAIHPIHSEAINWISDITDLEVSLFILLAFWCYLALDESRTFAGRRHLAIAGWFALALLSKEIAVVLAPVALVFEHFYREDRKRTSFLEKVGRYSTLWIVLGLYFVYRRLALGAMDALPLRKNLGLLETIYCGFQLLSHYVYKLFWPRHLQAYYVFTRSAHIGEFPVLAGIICLVSLIVLALVFLRSRPVVSFGVVWLLAFLGLALNARWMPAAAFAERYLFLPSVGFAWAAASGILALWNASRRRFPALRPALVAAGAVLLILGFIRIYTRNRDWHDNETLYTRTLRQDPHAVAIRVNLGAYYWGEGKQQLAVQQWLLAYADAPEYYPTLANLGMAAIFTKDWPSADKYLNEAAKLHPTASNTHYWLGMLREKQKRLADAEKEFLRAEALSPYLGGTYAELGNLYLQEGRLADAVKQLQVSAAQADDPVSWDALGDLYLRLGQLENAKQAYRSALEANAYDSDSHIGLGQIYEKRGDAAQAVKEYKLGMKLQPNNPIALAGIAKLEKPASN